MTSGLIQAQKQIYHDIIAAALTEQAFDGINLWGFSDQHTWVKNFYYDDSPLIFDERYKKKPSYYALRDAIKTITPGGKVGGGVLLDDHFAKDGKSWGKGWIPALPPSRDDSSDRNQTNSEGDSRPDLLQN